MYNNQFGYNPYYQPINSFSQPLQSSMVNTQNSTTNRQILNGKLVDNIEVVKSMDIPLDGTISYFPLADSSAIVTKQLKSNGTSETIIYKPIESENLYKTEYASVDDLEDLKEEIKDIKSELKKIKKG